MKDKEKMIERTKERVRNGGKREKKKDREKYREEAREMYSRKIDLRVGRGTKKVCGNIFYSGRVFFIAFSVASPRKEEKIIGWRERLFYF